MGFVRHHGSTRISCTLRLCQTRGCSPMKNITLSAEEKLVEAARERARAENTTLNAEFRRWLQEYVRREDRVEAHRKLLDRLRKKTGTGGRRFTRDEMNER